MAETTVTIDQALEMAQTMLRSGDARRAEDVAAQVLSHAPDCLQAWVLRANAVLSDHRHREALDYLGRALAIAPGNAAVVRARVEILRALGRFEAAVEAARQAPGDPGTADHVARITEFAADCRQAAAVAVPAHLTVLIPIAIDSPERLRNVHAVLDFFSRWFPGIAVIVAEDGGAGVHLAAGGRGRALAYRHLVVDHPSPLFHKTWMLNRLSEAASTDLVAAWDGDCLAAPAQISVACRRLLQWTSAVAFPYGGAFINVEGATADRLAAGRLAPQQVDPLGLDCRVVGMDAFGGAVLFRRSDLHGIGGYNERIVSWGLEDREVIVRAERLGLAVGRVEGPLFHLGHPRGPNSSDAHGMWDANLAEFRDIEARSAEDLRRDVAAGRFQAALAGTG